MTDLDNIAEIKYDIDTCIYEILYRDGRILEIRIEDVDQVQSINEAIRRRWDEEIGK